MTAATPAITGAGFFGDGPFGRLEQRLGLTGLPPDSFVRRAIPYLIIGWVIPMLIAFFEAHAAPRTIVLPFALDIEAHARALVAIPCLLFADGAVAKRLGWVVQCARRLGRRPVHGEIDALVERTRSLANHRWVEIFLVVGAYGLALVSLRMSALRTESWMVTMAGGAPTLTVAGTWHALVVLPLYLFLVTRWLWRWFVVGVFFWGMIRLKLRLSPAHADRAGGLAVVAEAPRAFAWVIAAVSTVGGAKWLDAVVYGGVSAKNFVMPIQLLTVLALLVAFAPLAVFALTLARVKSLALRRYGAVVARQDMAFQRRCVRGGAGGPVEAEDSSSFTDLNSIYDAIRALRIVPYRLSAVLTVIAAVLVPMLPVIVMIVPFPDLLRSVTAALI